MEQYTLGSIFQIVHCITDAAAAAEAVLLPVRELIAGMLLLLEVRGCPVKSIET